MSRRKQARPIRLLEDEETTASGAAGTAGVLGDVTSIEDGRTTLKNEELSERNPLICQRCQEQFDDVQEFMEHSSMCAMKSEEIEVQSDPEDMVVSEIDEDDEEVNGKRLEQVRRHRQDTENNNSISGSPAEDVEGPRLGFPFPTPAAAGHVTLEALQNTKVAVAQFAATTMANNSDNEAALQDLAVLQSTLFTLQHQQVFQLQLINQLQQQLSLNRVKVNSSTSPPPNPESIKRQPTPVESPPVPPTVPPPKDLTPTPLPPITQAPSIQQSPPVESSPVEISVPTSVPPQLQQPMCSISSSLASTIITHNNEPPPSLDEPNTLEMLQKRAQEVLDNASQGLLANNLADDIAFRRKDSLSYDKGRNEPFFKHRCRYCGKVFGSDSALQIHIRSHTGERPFKCNVCGSRFTTKGNLKVHFQRHAAKFPHIKMNPNPVPEHLDKYHPPLLAQLGQQSALSPGGPPHHPPHGFPGAPPFPSSSIPMYRPPAPPPELMNSRLQPSPQRPPENALRLFTSHPLFLKREEQDTPENLSKPIRSPTPVHITQDQKRQSASPSEIRDIKMDNKINADEMKPKHEMETDEHEQEPERYPSPSPYDESSEDSKFSTDEMERRSIGNEHHDNVQEEPENLSNKSNSVSIPLSITTGQKLPSNFLFANQSSPASSASSGSLGPFTHNVDPAKDPAIYTNLLPRPGSNDNSWESLIEITKTSETTKLQQLVDNIENKLTDPNQCVICHRVLSCKSALQMHYRTHTGERPFKCKICGRAFTTKGNLKTHMGVHRAKPPMRVLHQCPVCHKKFTNALVLQQHIRLHTGEPTDLTPEQIQAAEVKDLPSPGSFASLSNSMNPFFSQNIPLPGLSPLGPGSLPFHLSRYGSESDIKSEQDYLESRGDDDDGDDDDISSNDPHNFSTSPGASENNLQTSMASSHLTSSLVNYSAEDLCARNVITSPVQNGEKSPAPSGITSPGSSEIRSSPNQRSTPVQIPRPPSNQQPNSPAPSETNSSGALDLTPRSTQPPMSSPGPIPTQTSLFSNFALLPPGQPTTPLLSSAISSLTSTVLTSTPFSPLGLVNPAGRGNTTCNICFKTFACHSALEIHYRSHTKERPFKCSVCDRGFSTKGNMKQHMLTHKIRDMPQHMFDKPPSQHTPEEPPQLPIRETSLPPPPPISQHESEKPLPPVPPQEPSPDQLSKRAPTDTEMPLPKRPPSLQNSKHLCHVCNKNFSSSSALQIHMRTHTGDKPFRCTVCQKAFTTKGNLKVHMGTHMWSNGASRRGRRMSLDLPPIPMTPKDSEFLQRRPDLFYPYLPAPFLNGIQHKPINELNPLQSPQNGLANASKYSGLLGFGYPPPQPMRSHGGSPERPESRPPSREPERMWDLHFERKTSSESTREELLPPSREGLAA
ncbi:homeotic protein spalt-major isoform X2 [Agrilus planipennis]|uniref:Homeotic protein spalt-major n=1 Tax=Agrilus planipennis TaxID=224129 RepID=A0A1W4X0N3_AGRPL|nr:homeotic protein spalt-major isoform X2 [Agrilus planipennis]